MLMLLKKILVAIGLKAKKRSYDEAVKLADKMHAKTKQKCLVFYQGGSFMMITKRGIRNGKKNGYFRGLSYADIEKRALYAKG
jgi:hypothetical protein